MNVTKGEANSRGVKIEYKITGKLFKEHSVGVNTSNLIYYTETPYPKKYAFW